MAKAEILYVDRYINDILSNSAELKEALDILPDAKLPLFTVEAPEGHTNKTWIIFDDISASDTSTVGGNHVMSRPEFVVKICTNNTGFQYLKDAFEIVDDLLTAEGQTIDSSVYVGRFVRKMVMRDVDDLKGKRIYYLCAVYFLVSFEI